MDFVGYMHKMRVNVNSAEYRENIKTRKFSVYDIHFVANC